MRNRPKTFIYEDQNVIPGVHQASSIPGTTDPRPLQTRYPQTLFHFRCPRTHSIPGAPDPRPLQTRYPRQRSIPSTPYPRLLHRSYTRLWSIPSIYQLPQTMFNARCPRSHTTPDTQNPDPYQVPQTPTIPAASEPRSYIQHSNAGKSLIGWTWDVPTLSNRYAQELHRKTLMRCRQRRHGMLIM